MRLDVDRPSIHGLGVCCITVKNPNEGGVKELLVVERHRKVVQLVNERKSVRVTELSKIFSVTEETIRRDLEKLEKENKLARSHGGAVSISPADTMELHYFEREVINVAEKKEIALEATKYINPGDKIILDASSTAWYMAKILPDIPLTVLTNSIRVAMELSSRSKIDVISTGGKMLQKSLSFVGPLAESSLATYHVNKAFISCKALHFSRGISDSNEQQAQMKKKMMKHADTVYMMIDHTKFGVQAFSHIGGLDMIDYIIVNKETKKGDMEYIAETSMKVIKASQGKIPS